MPPAVNNLKTVTPKSLGAYLRTLLEKRVVISLMMWGPPGIGKSSIVAAASSEHGLSFVDVRLSQLAPTDLRGLPVPENGEARWYPPEFLPRSGTGVLFLDEINMAPPAVQGIAQQLILDRRVGSYKVPDGWYIWAAGNRKGDKAAVFDMPAPLTNRFLHLDIQPSMPDWREYALLNGLPEAIIAYLSLNESDMHKMTAGHLAWPSPRSWGMASVLRSKGMGIATAVGKETEKNFNKFLAVYGSGRLAEESTVEEVLNGSFRGKVPGSAGEDDWYAMTIALLARAQNATQRANAAAFMSQQAPKAFMEVYAPLAATLDQSRGLLTPLVLLAIQGRSRDRVAPPWPTAIWKPSRRTSSRRTWRRSWLPRSRSA